MTALAIVQLETYRDLKKLATVIHETWDTVDKAEATAADGRIALGAYLIQAKAILPHGQWEPWFQLNIERKGRSLRTAQECMALHKHPRGPVVARAEEKVEKTARVRKHEKNALANADLPVQEGAVCKSLPLPAFDERPAHLKTVFDALDTVVKAKDRAYVKRYIQRNW